MSDQSSQHDGSSLFPYETVHAFNETDIRIYKYVIAHMGQVRYMTIRELAAKLHMSTSSILRFCIKVGCEGYSDFKKHLERERKLIQKIPARKDLRELLLYFQRTATSAFEQKISQAVEMVRTAQKVIFVGQGSSGTLAKYGARYFSNLGKFSIGLEDTHYPITESEDAHTVVIALSESGETREVIDIVQQFRLRQCSILSITNSPNTTLAHLSDENIDYNVKQQRINGGYNATTQVPALFIIEAIARRLVEETPPRFPKI